LEQALVLRDEGVLDLLPHFSSNNELDLDAGEFAPFQAMIEEPEQRIFDARAGAPAGACRKLHSFSESTAGRCGKR
jgi:hypothetical protein